MKLSAVVLVLALLAPGAFEAQAKDNIDVASGNTSEAKPKPKKICKTEARGTGTRLSRSVCKTQEEWDAKEDGQEIGLRSKTSRADMQNIGGMNQP
ncbi:MAG: hypothetical protein IPG54_00180 [Sphingomonadales bacterium]|jgi:hypothetical protein|nr:hypothetical protein [Sphingomonadales bacterium]MBK9003872.1 hypothetical protein [Sphingomonadales bacterium]MBK9269049.1 hypothetical protein [Sphingomonadales bacterium]